MSYLDRLESVRDPVETRRKCLPRPKSKRVSLNSEPEYLQSLMDKRAYLMDMVYVLDRLQNSEYLKTVDSAAIVKKRRSVKYTGLMRVNSKIRRIDPDIIPPAHRNGPRPGKHSIYRLDRQFTDSKTSLIDLICSKSVATDFDPTEKLQIIKYAISCLTPKFARIIHMKFNLGYNNVYIGKLLGTTDANVHCLLKKALKRLRLIMMVKGSIKKIYDQGEFSIEEFVKVCPFVFTQQELLLLNLLREYDYGDCDTVRMMKNLGWDRTHCTGVIYRRISHMKMKLVFVGVSEQDVNKIHYLFRQSPLEKYSSDVYGWTRIRNPYSCDVPW